MTSDRRWEGEGKIRLPASAAIIILFFCLRNSSRPPRESMVVSPRLLNSNMFT